MAPNARVSLDADLMTQTVPCSVFPSNSAVSFSAVGDCQSKPILFSVSDNGLLFLLHGDNSTGRKPLVNLSRCFGIPTDATVTAHAVTQDHSGHIYLAFATRDNLYVVQPTSSLAWTSVNAEEDLTPWLFTGVPLESFAFTQLYMSKELGDGYPFLVARSDGALFQIVITPTSKTWLQEPMDLPYGVMPTEYMYCCVLDGAAGVIICHNSSEGTVDLFTIDFIAFNSGPQPKRIMRAFLGSFLTAIATYTNPDGSSDFIVSRSTDLLRIHPRYQGGSFNWNPTDDDHKYVDFASCKELRVEQSGTKISVWAENDSNEILYQQFHLDLTQPLTPAVKLITRKQGGGAFAVYLDPITGSQNLFAVDDLSRLTRLTQDPMTRLWQHLPVLVPSLGLNKDFTSFTSHINVADSNGNALAASTVLLCSSSPTDLAVNGMSLTVDSSGVKVKTDSRGNLTVIHRVNDIASVMLTVQDAPGEPSLLGQTYSLNPAKKVQEGLSKITDATSLNNVTLPDGSKLLDGSTASSEKIAQAGTTIGQLHQHLQSLPRDGSLRSASLNHVSTKYALAVASSDDSTPWDFWHWLSNEVESIEDWVVKVVDDTAHWVITIGENTFNFLLDCATHVLKAIGWVLQQVVTDMDKIIQWVGFLFQWDDILAVHSDFVQVVNDVLGLAPTAFAGLEDKVEGWFDQLQQTLQSLHPEDKYMTQSFDPTSASKINVDTGPVNAAINAPGSNWSNYQLEHGGIREHLAAASMSASDEKDSDDPLSQIWKGIVEPTYERIKNDLSTFWNDLAHSFGDSKSFSLAGVFTKAGIDLANTIIGALKGIVLGFLKLMNIIITTLSTALNTPLNIPLLSPLYKTITKGKDLTILDAISLLVAIPTSVTCKILTGKKPSELRAACMPKNEDVMSLRSARSLEGDAPSDEMLELLEKMATNVKAIRPYMPFVSLAVNFVQMYMAVADWVEPGSEPSSSGVDYKGMVFSLLAWISSFPDCDEKRPGLQFRVIDWVIGIGLVVRSVAPEKICQGVVGLYVATIQLIPVAVSIGLDIAATEDEYPGRTVSGTAANSIDRVASQVAKMLSNLILVTEGSMDEVLIPAATIATGIKYATQALKLAVPAETDCVGLHGL